MSSPGVVMCYKYTSLGTIRRHILLLFDSRSSLGMSYDTAPEPVPIKVMTNKEREN